MTDNTLLSQWKRIKAVQEAKYGDHQFTDEEIDQICKTENEIQAEISLIDNRRNSKNRRFSGTVLYGRQKFDELCQKWQTLTTPILAFVNMAKNSGFRGIIRFVGCSRLGGRDIDICVGRKCQGDEFDIDELPVLFEMVKAADGPIPRSTLDTLMAIRSGSADGAGGMGARMVGFEG